ncbi:MAG: FHA domain-containing protein [Planctomycetota bacterium]
MEVTLVMFKADGTRRDFPLRGDRMTIGRKNSCDLRIPLSSVSRQHCEVRLEGGGVSIQDLGSSNGTFVNDQRVQQETLRPGDAVVVGPVVFTVVIDGHPEEVKPVRTLLATRNDAANTPAMGVDAIQDDEVDDAAADLSEASAAKTQVPAPDDDPIAALQAMVDEEEDDGFDFDAVELTELDDDDPLK